MKNAQCMSEANNYKPYIDRYWCVGQNIARNQKVLDWWQINMSLKTFEQSLGQKKHSYNGETNTPHEAVLNTQSMKDIYSLEKTNWTELYDKFNVF